MQQACRLCPTRAAMFDGLSNSLEKAWDIVRKDGKLTADNIKSPMREIRRALLEADVRPSLLLFIRIMSAPASIRRPSHAESLVLEQTAGNWPVCGRVLKPPK